MAIWTVSALRAVFDGAYAAEGGKEAKKLKPVADADRVSFIRRVSFDLTGLPPTPAEIDAFVNDESADAYEKLVDRLGEVGRDLTFHDAAIPVERATEHGDSAARLDWTFVPFHMREPVFFNHAVQRLAPPRFLHHPLIMKSVDQKLSKSDRDTGVRDLRAQGWTAPRVIGRAAYLAGLIPEARDMPAEEVSRAMGLAFPDIQA